MQKFILITLVVLSFTINARNRNLEIVSSIKKERSPLPLEEYNSRARLVIGNYIDPSFDGEIALLTEKALRKMLNIIPRGDYQSIIKLVKAEADKHFSGEDVNERNSKIFLKSLAPVIRFSVIDPAFFSAEQISKPLTDEMKEMLVEDYVNCISKSKNAYFEGKHCYSHFINSILPSSVVLVAKFRISQTYGKFDDTIRAEIQEKVKEYRSCLLVNEYTDLCTEKYLKILISMLLRIEIKKALRANSSPSELVEELKNMNWINLNKCASSKTLNTKKLQDEIMDLYNFCFREIFSSLSSFASQKISSSRLKPNIFEDSQKILNCIEVKTVEKKLITFNKEAFDCFKVN